MMRLSVVICSECAFEAWRLGVQASAQRSRVGAAQAPRRGEHKHHARHIPNTNAVGEGPPLSEARLERDTRLARTPGFLQSCNEVQKNVEPKAGRQDVVDELEPGGFTRIQPAATEDDAARSVRRARGRCFRPEGTPREGVRACARKSSRCTVAQNLRRKKWVCHS